MAAVAGTNVCLRRVDVNQIYDLIAQEQVTHYYGAPTVHQMLIDVRPRYAEEEAQGVRHNRRCAAAGSGARGHGAEQF